VGSRQRGIETESSLPTTHGPLPGPITLMILRNNFILICALLACAIMLPTTLARAQDATRFPFVIPWDDAAPTITNVGALNPIPAGGGGFVRAKKGHFYDEQGRRIRFIGVNIVGSANFPDKATAEKVAARLHKFGVNIVRLHHMDAEFAHPNIFDHSSKDHQHLDKDSLDRLDYFVSQLKQHGIYVNINLHVSREFTAEDGFPETEGLHDFDKAVDFFEPRMIELQKNYARDLLTHLNPYTHNRYVDEPAVAVIEVNNENTLLGEAWGSKLDNLPPHYKGELVQQWNAWLKQKYVDTRGVKRAWSAADKPFGPNILQNADFSRGAEHWNLELNTAPALAKMELPEDVTPPKGATGKVIRLNVLTLGSQNWHLQFHQADIDLTDGEPYTLTFWAKADRARVLPVYTGVDRDDYHHIGLESTVPLTAEWQRFTLSFTANRTLKDHNRLTFVLGDALGTIDLAGITLQPGVENPFPAGAKLEGGGTIPLQRPVTTPAGQDWIAFLLDTEHNYVQAMHDYLKNSLKANANLVGSQVSWGGVGGALRESLFDVADNHAYWQHPNFPHQPWDPKDWTIGNTALVRDGTDYPFADLARYRLAGKPYTISEYNSPAPNDFRAETIPTLAAFAAVQDWDGFYLFDYCSDRDAYNTDHIKGFFSIDSDPAKMAFLPAAAMVFERLDMALAGPELRLHLAPSDVPGLLAKNGPSIVAEWQAAGVKVGDAINHRLSLSFAPNHKRETSDTSPRTARQTEIVNTPDDHGAIEWQDLGTDQARFTAVSPSSKVMVGFLAGQNTDAGGWQVQMPEGGTRFAALTLTAMDGKDTEHSGSMLLTAVGDVENLGMVWNAARTSIGDHWGSGPTQAEGVAGAVTIRTVVTYATVYALDGTGKRLGKVESKLYGGQLAFNIGPDNKTLWYEIEAGYKR
jgi:hypothetical protein